MRKFLFDKTFPDLGLLIVRAGVGISFFVHGLPKVTGGTEKWAKLGAKMSLVGLDFAHTFWGFMAAFAEAGGGIMLALGLLFRIHASLLAFTMFIAFLFHVTKGDEFGDYSHSMEAMFLFITLMLTGPGKYSLDRLLFGKKDSLS